MTQPPQLIKDLVDFLLAKLNDPKNMFYWEHDPQCAPTGSRVICNPPVMNTDNDWLVHVPEILQEEAMDFLEKAGATHSAEQETYPDGVCYRLGDLNPVLIWDYDTYYRWVAATYFASKLNPPTKAERVYIFQALVDMTVNIDKLVL